MSGLTVQERLLLLAILFLLVLGAFVRYCRYQNPPEIDPVPLAAPRKSLAP